MGYFRLDGPFACDKAREVAEDELWRPVRDRKLAANAAFGVLGVIFGALSGLCWVAERSLRVITGPGAAYVHPERPVTPRACPRQ